MTRSDGGRSPLDQPWSGQTYYGRPQLKPAPFEPGIVGGYIFLAGLSGASALLGSVIEGAASRKGAAAARQASPLVRRSRYLSLLAPTLGSALLVYDLHTPSRFYNMLRVAKRTSPMSIGTWILMGFSACAGISGMAQLVADRRPRWRWPRRLATLSQRGAGLAGAGLSTYTAALVSATSTPAWAAAPRATAVRFASSSIATAASALSLGAAASNKRQLDTLLLGALAADMAATLAVNRQLKAAGIADRQTSGWDKIEKFGATGTGVMLPIGLLLASKLCRDTRLAAAAEVLALGGSAAMRISILGSGIHSAADPLTSMRFAQRDNLPESRR